MRASIRCLAIVCLTIALMAPPREARAWGAEAHQIIALLADRLLQEGDPQVQKKVADILATDKSNTWTKTDIGGEATWADALRERSPEGRVATSKWHYVKLDPDNPDLTKACFGRPALPHMAPASHGLQDDCIVDKIEQFVKELRDPATFPGERLMALQFLLNLVGDLHDPLYAIERNDQSGNCVALLLPGAKDPVRLSGYWDDVLVAETQGRDPAKAAGEILAGLTAANIQKWSGGTPAEWAQESHAVAKSVVYSFVKEPPEGKYAFPSRKGEKDACGAVPVYRVDAGYRDRGDAAVKDQLAKAGVRLAFLLRDGLR
jgi:hypothetical protein